VSWQSAAALVTDEKGQYVDANEAGLELLGVASVEELRATPPAAFQATPPDTDEQQALRTAFLDAVFQGLIGEGTIRRLDGELVRVRTVITPIPEGGFRVLLDPVERPTTNLTPKVYKVSDVLAEWRSAERRLVTVDTDSEEGRDLLEDVELLRAQYRLLFEMNRPSTG
jgi:hypothetical protein